MKPSVKATAVLAAVALAGAVLAAEKGAAPGYEVKGKYYEACGCAVSCPCPAGKFTPTEGHCDAAMLFHIDKGHAGDVAMDGLNWIMVIKSPQGAVVKEALVKGDLDLASIYLDDKANEKQRAAFGKLLPALLGNAEFKGSKPPVFATISVDVKGDTAKVQIADGSKLSMEIENVDIGGETKHGKKTAGNSHRIVITNAAPFPWVTDVMQGYSKNFHYDDYGSKWDYKERNAYFATISAKGSLAAEQKAEAAAKPAKKG